jgi:hypothetical protein
MSKRRTSHARGVKENGVPTLTRRDVAKRFARSPTGAIFSKIFFTAARALALRYRSQ